MNKLKYSKVFEVLVKETKDYLLNNNLKAMVLGISGGIDSTVTAAICHEVSKQTGIPLIGRSLPIKNKEDELYTSKLVGGTFCSDFIVYNLRRSYEAALLDACIAAKDATFACSYYLDELEEMPSRTPIANGNLQARCRMQHLYDLASINNGLVMSTDNQTEYQLGFWTIHGDVGDFDPLQDLWKTEVYELARYIFDMYDSEARKIGAYLSPNASYFVRKLDALKHSINLTPTDGLGISNSDLDQIGAKSYAEVDDILQTLISISECGNPNAFMLHSVVLSDKYGEDVVKKVWKRHIASEFKRKKAPIYVERSKYEN